MFKNHLKLALKVLLRQKMISFINLFGISFTLTILLAATAVYTSAVISNPIEKNLSRCLFLRHVELSNEQSTNAGPANAYLNESCVKPLKDVENVSVQHHSYQKVTTYIQSERVDIDVKSTDHNYWNVLSFQFLEGRPYSKEELEGGQQVAVIAKNLSFRLFGNSSALGKSITLNHANYKIIGVVMDVPKLYQSAYAQLWQPLDYAMYLTSAKSKSLNHFSYSVILLTKGKSYFNSIRQHFAENVSRLKPPDNFTNIYAPLETSFDRTFGEFIYSSNFPEKETPKYFYAKLTLAIAGILLLFLMVPLLNLTNLTVSRIFERCSEIGVRKAFGATKHQMTSQFVYENLVVTLIGGILGFSGAWTLLWIINASGVIQFGLVTFSFRIFIYGLIVIFLFGLVSGLYPALKMSKLQIVETMKGGNK